MVLKLFLVVLLVLVVLQDIRQRQIHVLLPLAILFIGLSINFDKILLLLAQWSSSLVFLILVFAILAIYATIKFKEMTNPFSSMIGVGDFCYLFCVIPLFSFHYYLLYFSVGMIFSLLLFLMVKQIIGHVQTVPLAGYLSLFLMAILVVENFSSLKFTII